MGRESGHRRSGRGRHGTVRPGEAITLRVATPLPPTEFHTQIQTEIRTVFYDRDGMSDAGTYRSQSGTLGTQFVPKERNSAIANRGPKRNRQEREI